MGPYGPIWAHGPIWALWYFNYSITGMERHLPLGAKDHKLTGTCFLKKGKRVSGSYFVFVVVLLLLPVYTPDKKS